MERDYGEWNAPKEKKQKAKSEEKREETKAAPKKETTGPPKVTRWKCVFSLPGRVIGVIEDPSMYVGSTPRAVVAYSDRVSYMGEDEIVEGESVSPRWRLYHPNHSVIETIESRESKMGPDTSDPSFRITWTKL